MPEFFALVGFQICRSICLASNFTVKGVLEGLQQALKVFQSAIAELTNARFKIYRYLSPPSTKEPKSENGGDRLHRCKCSHDNTAYTEARII